MSPLPKVPHCKQDRNSTNHNARVLHRLHAHRHRVGKHENDVEDNDVRASDGEDDGTPGRGYPELGEEVSYRTGYMGDEISDLPAQALHTSAPKSNAAKSPTNTTTSSESQTCPRKH